MEATVRHHFAHDVDRVFSVLTDPDFLKRRCESQGEKNVVVQIDRDGPRLHIRVERDLERNLPAIAKKIFNPKSRVTDRQTWETTGDQRISSWTVEIQGQKRVAISGRLTLAAAGGGCDYTEAFKVAVNVPLIAGPLEKYVLGEAESSIRQQLAFMVKELG